MSRIVHGDCERELNLMPSETVDLIVTDPPYGYSFMGKDWDKAVPSVQVWKQCLRVLKPGGFAFIMSAPRSDVQAQMIVRLQEAGFRMDFTPIYWTYASGFPKSTNIGKAVDKKLGGEREIVRPRTYELSKDGASYGKGINTSKPRGQSSEISTPATDQAKALDGSYGGFQPKPAVEVILVAMKPLSEKTFVDQALKNGKGVTWLDDCRIPTTDQPECCAYRHAANDKFHGFVCECSCHFKAPAQGRFPANLICSDDVLNDGVEYVGTHSQKPTGGISGFGYRTNSGNFDGGKGSYSRYFDLDAWWAKTFPFLIVPKASKGEKNEGCENLEGQVRFASENGSGQMMPTKLDTPHKIKGNAHPTVKPLKLMSYLITLGSRTGDTVLDPFVGSGTTAVAAHTLGRSYVGIERELEYVEIAKARLRAAEPYQPTLIAAE